MKLAYFLTLLMTFGVASNAFSYPKILSQENIDSASSLAAVSLILAGVGAGIYKSYSSALSSPYGRPVFEIAGGLGCITAALYNAHKCNYERQLYKAGKLDWAKGHTGIEEKGFIISRGLKALSGFIPALAIGLPLIGLGIKDLIQQS